MKWTTNRPTVDGFYWCHCVGMLSGTIYTTVVKVTNNALNVVWDGENFNIDSHSFVSWSDSPILEPEQ